MSNIFIINITLSSEFWIDMFMSVWRICRRLSAHVKVLLRSAAAMPISHLRYENRTCEVQLPESSKQFSGMKSFPSSNQAL